MYDDNGIVIKDEDRFSSSTIVFKCISPKETDKTNTELLNRIKELEAELKIARDRTNIKISHSKNETKDNVVDIHFAIGNEIETMSINTLPDRISHYIDMSTCHTTPDKVYINSNPRFVFNKNIVKSYILKHIFPEIKDELMDAIATYDKVKADIEKTMDVKYLVI